MKVLLTTTFFQDYRYPLYLPSENLGLAYLASYLRAKGINVRILDCQLYEITSDKILESIEEEYDLIGISVSFHLAYYEAKRIAQKLKVK